MEGKEETELRPTAWPLKRFAAAAVRSCPSSNPGIMVQSYSDHKGWKGDVEGWKRDRKSDVKNETAGMEE